MKLQTDTNRCVLHWGSAPAFAFRSLLLFFSLHAVCVSSPKAQVAFVLQKAQQRQSKCEWTCLRERSLSREGLCVNTLTAGQLTAAFKTTAFNIIFHPLSDENPGYIKKKNTKAMVKSLKGNC